jgi:dienelactone hydrolase
MGLIWSMELDGSRSAADDQPLSPVHTRFWADGGGPTVAAAEVRRHRLPDGITREPIADDRIVGTLFRAGSGQPKPGVILLGGAEGGIHEADAALLAGHGLTVLALAYFGMSGVSPHLSSIPLEYFDIAVEVLLSHPATAGPQVGITGGSRGAEAALLVGSHNPRVGAVVSVVGSGLITQGIVIDGPLVRVLENHVPSWTRRGKALPFLPNVVGADLREQAESGALVELRRAFLPPLETEDLEPLIIAVERIRGPVLLVSAGDDRMWPSDRLSQVAVDRGRTLGHPSLEHVRFPTAGHGITGAPYVPTTELVGPGPGVTFAYGGSPAVNAAARVETWRRSKEFLKRSLDPSHSAKVRTS